MQTKPESTQASFNEVWEVTVGKQVFRLNGEQVAVLKKADTNGHRGLVWFGALGISIPHISSIERVEKRPKNALTAGTQNDIRIDPKQMDKIRAKHDFLRKPVNVPVPSNQRETSNSASNFGA